MNLKLYFVECMERKMDRRWRKKNKFDTTVFRKVDQCCLDQSGTYSESSLNFPQISSERYTKILIEVRKIIGRDTMCKRKLKYILKKHQSRSCFPKVELWHIKENGHTDESCLSASQDETLAEDLIPLNICNSPINARNNRWENRHDVTSTTNKRNVRSSHFQNDLCNEKLFNILKNFHHGESSSSIVETIPNGNVIKARTSHPYGDQVLNLVDQSSEQKPKDTVLINRFGFPRRQSLISLGQNSVNSREDLSSYYSSSFAVGRDYFQPLSPSQTFFASTYSPVASQGNISETTSESNPRIIVDEKKDLPGSTEFCFSTSYSESQILETKEPNLDRFLDCNPSNRNRKSRSISLSKISRSSSQSVSRNSRSLPIRSSSMSSSISILSSPRRDYRSVSRSSRSSSSFSRNTSEPASCSSRSRSPSIPRRHGSPSFLDRRRITSARKRPVPYHRSSPSVSSSPSSPGSRNHGEWSSHGFTLN